MTWNVSLSYRRRTEHKKGDRGEEHAEIHRFDTLPEAEDFATRARHNHRGWSPPGSYDHDVSDPAQVHDAKRPA